LIASLETAETIALDTETTSLYPTRARLVGLSFSTRPGEAFYLPLRHNYPGAPRQLKIDYVLSRLKPVLEDENIKKAGQNIKYDYIVLKREGIELRGIQFDTMILSYLLEPNWASTAWTGWPSITCKSPKYPLTAWSVKAKTTNHRQGSG